ncbi:MAG TPA: SMC family ATPase [Streptosporangiaceae bacterium]|nr:SMC family ATPase [Streptosporangiaceae bacterium]
MRLHSLELTAIGPYAAPQRIDFERLSGSGLFLLEGPTGAGKTTILDAITFALYGGLSGEGAGRDRLHSDFADPGAEPSVTLEFSVRGERYLIHRVPDYQRLKKRGDGFTQQATRVHLQRHEGGGWVSQSSNKAEVGELITDAIGLNRAQFTQVMLLPQGEFAKFLRSDDDDRRTLLTKLFGTELYDRITAELDQRRRAAAAARHEAGAQISAAAAAAAEAAGLDAAAREELLGLSRADRATRLKELDAELATAIALSEEARGVAADRLAAARTAAERETRQAELTARLAGALERLAAHEATKPEHAGRVQRLAAARRAEPVRPLLAGLDEARAVRAGLAVVDGSGPAEQAVAEAEAAERAAAELEHLARQEAALPERQTELAGLRDAATAAADLAGRLELARQQLPERIETVTARLGEARLAAAGLADALSQRAVVAGQLDAASRAAELAEQHAGLDEFARAAIDTHQELVGAYQQAMAARLENMAAELAGRLEDGAACPVCGSAEHPEPAQSLDDAVSAADVAAAGERQEAAAAEREQAESARDALAAELASAVGAAGGVPAADLEAELAALDERVGQAEQGAADAAGLAAELTDLTAERAKLDEEVRQAAAADATAQSRAAHAAAELDRLRADLTAAAQPYPSVGARQAALRQAAAAGRALAEALTRLAAAVAAEQQAAERAEQELRAGGFASLAEASATVLPADEQARLDDEVSAWTTELAGLRAGTQAAELAGLDPVGGPAAQARAQAATAELETAVAAEREVSEAGQALAGQDRRLRQRLAELEAAEAAADQLAEQTDPVLRLAGLTRGMDGQRRITLTTYVLRRWFEQVVAAANARLAAMSAGRYELTRSEDPEKKNQRTGLTLAVIDRHTGEERSPRSLSGGETFYTSLALALGLADVVRAEAGGVELDTLFIDEGFGSLDAETLDQVMAVIDDLRDRGRVVGIVSHVADLKDRVYERLEIRRRADGSSMATVVA